MINNKPSWENDFNDRFSDIGDLFSFEPIIDFICQTIKAEREQAVKERDEYWHKVIKNPAVIRDQAVKEAYQSPEFTEVIEMEKRKAVREVIGELIKGGKIDKDDYVIKDILDK